MYNCTIGIYVQCGRPLRFILFWERLQISTKNVFSSWNICSQAGKICMPLVGSGRLWCLRRVRWAITGRIFANTPGSILSWSRARCTGSVHTASGITRRHKTDFGQNMSATLWSSETHHNSLVIGRGGPSLIERSSTVKWRVAPPGITWKSNHQQ